MTNDQRNRVYEALVCFIERATSKDATHAEIEALPSIAATMVHVSCFSSTSEE